MQYLIYCIQQLRSVASKHIESNVHLIPVLRGDFGVNRELFVNNACRASAYVSIRQHTPYTHTAALPPAAVRAGDAAVHDLVSELAADAHLLPDIPSPATCAISVYQRCYHTPEYRENQATDALEEARRGEVSAGSTAIT